MLCADFLKIFRSQMVSNSFLASNFISNSWVRKPWMLILLCYIIPGRQCEPHSLRYYYTGMSQSGELKEFQAMTYLDDQQIMTCNNRKIMCRPVASWIKDKEEGIYWEEEYSSFKGWQKAFYENLLLLKHWYNNTNSLLILQLWYGCDIEDDGYINVHYQYGSEGRDYPLFATFRQAWDPIMLNAQIIDEMMNKKRDIMESVKSYVADICPEALRKYIGYGRDKLEWKVPPEVRIVPLKVTDRVIRLQCLVYGFHPRPVDVKWVRNGEDDVPSDDMSAILPHPDGTYQIRVSVEMPKREGETYSCHVDHSSLKEEITTLWDPGKNSLVNWIKCFVLLGAFMLCLSIIMLILFCIVHTKEASGDIDSPSKESNASSSETLQTDELPCTNPLKSAGSNFSATPKMLHDFQTF
ncbi:zinc-alpha-2-glycoprotein-like [Aquarana catesbeiana]|uniref:zinc-alpha-2-glycoprotein-like n=1 Tax=Aquarana catesbeiana TaxID=8400 RepID=UPI003CC9CEAF